MNRANEKFWKIIAVLALVSIAWLAHGLHQPGGVVPPARILRLAEGSQIIQYSGNIVVTTSEDGRALYFWNLGGPDPQIPRLESTRRYVFKEY